MLSLRLIKAELLYIPLFNSLWDPSFWTTISMTAFSLSSNLELRVPRLYSTLYLKLLLGTFTIISSAPSLRHARLKKPLSTLLSHFFSTWKLFCCCSGRCIFYFLFVYSVRDAIFGQSVQKHETSFQGKQEQSQSSLHFPSNASCTSFHLCFLWYKYKTTHTGKG